MRRLERRLLVFHHRDAPLSRGDSSAENGIVGEDLVCNRATWRRWFQVKRGPHGDDRTITHCGKLRRRV